MTRFIIDEDDFLPACSEPVAEFSDRGSADAIAGLLQGENIHTKVHLIGEASGAPRKYLVLVDRRQLHRARWFLADNEISEGELTYLATGELGDKSES